MGRPSKYPGEFLAETVQLVRTSDRLRRIAGSLGLSDSTLKNCGGRPGRPLPCADPDAVSEDERAELRRLRKENAEPRVDRQILRKAAA